MSAETSASDEAGAFTQFAIAVETPPVIPPSHHPDAADWSLQGQAGLSARVLAVGRAHAQDWAKPAPLSAGFPSSSGKPGYLAVPYFMPPGSPSIIRP